MAGFFDGLLDSIQNPLFLGGIGMMSGGPEGLQQGLMAGGQFAQQKNKLAEQKRKQMAVEAGIAGIPGLSDGERQAMAADPDVGLSYLAKMAAERNDPNVVLNRRYKEAQIRKLEREPAGGEAPSTVREYQYFNSLPPDQKAQYLTMKRANPYLDLGTNYMQPNPVDPAAPGRTVQKDLAGAEREKVVGRETGEGQMALPKIARSLQQYEVKSQNVDTFIDEAIAGSQGFGATGFAGGLSRNVYGTPAYDLVKKMAPIEANLGFDELQTMRDNSPTGGALGAIAVQEMEMLKSTLGSIDTAQSQDQLKLHLTRLKEIKSQFRDLKRKAYEEDVARFGKGAVPNPNGGGQPAPAPSTKPAGGFKLLGVIE